MYVCIYVCMYVNILTVCGIRIQCRAGPAVVFRSSCFNGQAAEACSYAALIGPVAAIRTHRTGLAAIVHSHTRTKRFSCNVSVCMYVDKFIPYLMYVCM